ncbi:MAG: cbb3-type cytochrome c oxidase subunit I [Rickettsiaceae bacterium]|nr:cbb3-type cytochrome c oxidase subunit I [Rickettsiaceae bacterium]
MQDIQENLDTIRWLKNGVIALAIAGLYSIVLVLLRTPQLSHLFADKSMFKSALVIHVNLSVLVWLLSIMAMSWSLNNFKTGFERIYSILAFLGMLLMALSPLYPESVPVMNNYIPMLENIAFILGLSLFGVGVLCFAVQTVFTSFTRCYDDYGGRLIAIANFTSSLMFILVWCCFALSYKALSDLVEIVPLDLDFYYEMLYWSGGHLLQFIYTQLLMLVLLSLVEAWKGGEVKFSSAYEVLLALNFFLSLAVFVGHARFDVGDGSFKEFYTLHMIYTGGVVPTIFIALLYFEIFQGRRKNIAGFIPVSFLASSLLFLSGGLIGVIISGVNVTIPAHYHGSIVGISVALMGLSYLFCFRSKIQESISGNLGVIGKFLITSKKEQPGYGLKTASWQVIILTVGQLLHVAGLALAGGYGVLRKSPNGDIALSAKVYMGMVGGGGLIAIIGGLMFVYICVRNLYQSSD